jgi:hypothetical protein
MSYPKLKIAPKEVEEIVTISKNDLLEQNLRLVMSDSDVAQFKTGVHTALTIWNGGYFAGKAFCLNSAFDWVLGKDESDYLLLVPIQKRF